MTTTTKLGPLNLDGYVWSETCQGLTGIVDGHEVVLDRYRGVFVDRGYTAEPRFVKADDRMTEKVMALAEEDRQIRRNCAQKALEEAQGNEALREVMLMSMAYQGNGVHCLEEREDRPGIQFAVVGHNASHHFYAGADKNGQRYYLAIGDAPWEEKGYDVLFKPIASFTDVAYWGHY